VLMVDCPHCGKSFPAAIQDDRTFEMMRVERLLERCPSCFHASRFTKAEYHRVPDEGPNDAFRPTR
jgi:endogenous inhibitor of DNA gyrase (YacG/DUF329 family)